MMGKIWRFDLNDLVATQVHHDDDWVYVKESQSGLYVAIKEDGSLWFGRIPEKKHRLPDRYFSHDSSQLGFRLLSDSNNFVLAVENGAVDGLTSVKHSRIQTNEYHSILALDVNGKAWALSAPYVLDESIKPPLPILENLTIIDATSGNSEGAVVQTANDQIWSFGWTRSGILGYPVQASGNRFRQPKQISGSVEGLGSVVSIKQDLYPNSGLSRITALDQRGQLWHWGDFQWLRNSSWIEQVDTPTRIHTPSRNVDFCLTKTHTYFLDATGTLYQYGISAGRDEAGSIYSANTPRTFVSDLILNRPISSFNAISSPLMQHHTLTHPAGWQFGRLPSIDYLALIDHQKRLTLLQAAVWQRDTHESRFTLVEQPHAMSLATHQAPLFDLSIEHIDLFSRLVIA